MRLDHQPVRRPLLAHSCPGRVRRYVRNWRKPTPHSKAHPLVNRLILAFRFASLTPLTILTAMFEFSLPTRATTVPDGPDWLHEIKYDGLYEASRVKKFFEINIFSFP